MPRGKNKRQVIDDNFPRLSYRAEEKEGGDRERGGRVASAPPPTPPGFLPPIARCF